MRIDHDRRDHDADRELVRELRASFTFVLVAMGILLFASIVGVTLS